MWEAANPEVKFTGEASGLSLEVGDLDPATTYVYRARVRGRGQWSATSNFTTSSRGPPQLSLGGARLVSATRSKDGLSVKLELPVRVIMKFWEKEYILFRSIYSTKKSFYQPQRDSDENSQQPAFVFCLNRLLKTLLEDKKETDTEEQTEEKPGSGVGAMILSIMTKLDTIKSIKIEMTYRTNSFDGTYTIHNIDAEDETGTFSCDSDPMTSNIEFRMTSDGNGFLGDVEFSFALGDRWRQKPLMLVAKYAEETLLHVNSKQVRSGTRYTAKLETGGKKHSMDLTIMEGDKRSISFSKYTDDGISKYPILTTDLDLTMSGEWAEKWWKILGHIEETRWWRKTKVDLMFTKQTAKVTGLLKFKNLLFNLITFDYKTNGMSWNGSFNAKIQREEDKSFDQSMPINAVFGDDNLDFNITFPKQLFQDGKSFQIHLDYKGQFLFQFLQSPLQPSNWGRKDVESIQVNFVKEGLFSHRLDISNMFVQTYLSYFGQDNVEEISNKFKDGINLNTTVTMTARGNPVNTTDTHTSSSLFFGIVDKVLKNYHKHLVALENIWQYISVIDPAYFR